MKAVVLSAFGDLNQFRMETLPIPKPKKGEVRIQIKVAAFNPVDYKMRQGRYGGALPLILGADCSGVIDAVGEGVEEFVEGDEVYAFIFGQGTNGTYAEYTCISSSFVAKKPHNLSFEAAASVPLVGLTAYRALVGTQALQKGKPIFIAGGSGGVGLLAIQLARYFEAGPLFTTAGSEESVSHLVNHLKVKRDHILLYKGLNGEEMKRELLHRNGGNLFASTFDFVGYEMKRLCMEVADFEGHVASIVSEQTDLWTQLHPLAVSKSLAFHFVFVGAEAYGGPLSSWTVYQRQLIHLKELIESNRLRIPEPQVLGSLSLETIQKAHLLLEKGHVQGKLVMSVSSSQKTQISSIFFT